MGRVREFSFDFDFKQLVTYLLAVTLLILTKFIHIQCYWFHTYIQDIGLILDFSQFHPKLLYYRQKGHENCVIIRVPCPYSTWSCTIKARGLDFLLFVIPSSLAENEQRKPFPTAFC